MNQAPHVAIVGATGAVGVEILSCLETRNVPVGSLKLLASARSAGKQVAFRGEMLTVEELTEKSFDGVDIALFSAGGGISLKFAPIAAAAGCVVIDNSSAFRQDPDVPLVVPEINPEAALNHPRNIIANPNCTTIITLMALFPLHQRFGLKTVIASSYQAVSGRGQHGIAELESQVRAVYEGKTAALLTTALRFGAMSANATEAQLEAVTDFGYNLGLAFQVIDDILDLTASTEKLGKTAGKDVNAQKSTCPALIGMDGARSEAKCRTQAALDALMIFPEERRTRLVELANYLLNREY